MTKRRAKSKRQPASPDRSGHDRSERQLTGDAGNVRHGHPGDRARAPARLVGAQGTIRSRKAMLVLVAASALASFLMFPSVGWWPLGFVCLVPWLVCVCTGERARFVYFSSWLFGLAFFLINIRWLFQVTPPGYFALCGYYSLFFPLAAWPIRHMYRRHNTSVALITPIVWVATEYLRSLTAVGFPWLLLGHTQYKILTMIQISDLVGAYGVSFVLAMVNGWLTDLLIQPILIWRKDQATRLPIGSLTMALVLLGTVIYGGLQRSHRHLEPGPRIAVIQHDFPMSVGGNVNHVSTVQVRKAYLELARRAAAEKPDLIVLPETAIGGSFNTEYLAADKDTLKEILKQRYPSRYKLPDLQWWQGFAQETRDSFQAVSDESGVPIVLGGMATEWKPTEIPPRVEVFNSAFLLEPGRTEPTDRYDKVHLVLFGEYVPFRFSYPWLYQWLNSLTPFGANGIEYSLTPGEQFHPFSFTAASCENRSYRAGVPICYEEIMPYIARAFTEGQPHEADHKSIDILLSISNDGWFREPAELEQHLSGAVFRAVENRIAVARSVNTGASGVLHPNGKIHSLVGLSEARVKLLEPVEETLERIQTIAEQLSEKINAATLDKLTKIIHEQLKPALGELGSEFAYMGLRLEDRITDLRFAKGEAIPSAREDLLDQIDADIDTIERWTDRPWTAPGYVISEVRCDPRLTLYSRWGDWFAQALLVLMGLMLLDWLLRRVLRRKDDRRSGAQSSQPEEATA